MTPTSGEYPPSDEPIEFACRVADTVLHEGRPYDPCRSAGAEPGPPYHFGVLVPPGFTATGEPSACVTECLLEALPDAEIRLRLRFLHLQSRTVWRAEGAGFEPVPELTVGGTTYRPGHEAVPDEAEVVLRVEDLVGAGRTIVVGVPGESSTELITDTAGQLCGRIITEHLALRAGLHVRAERLPAPHGLTRLRTSVANTHGWAHVAAPRVQALRRSLLGTHLIMEVIGGAFLSLVAPPGWARTAACECRSKHMWPVLIGMPGYRNLLLSSPVVLYDYPALSSGDLAKLVPATSVDELIGTLAGPVRRADRVREGMAAPAPAPAPAPEEADPGAGP